MRGRTVHNSQRDLNEKIIVEAARKVGKFVTRIKNSDPSGCPDLIVITPGADVPIASVTTVEQMLDLCSLDLPVVLIEVKEPRKKLKPTQEQWWRMAGVL